MSIIQAHFGASTERNQAVQYNPIHGPHVAAIVLNYSIKNTWNDVRQICENQQLMWGALTLSQLTLWNL